MPQDWMIGNIFFFVLFVCVSVNFNFYYNFWNVMNREFIIGMCTPVMVSFQI